MKKITFMLLALPVIAFSQQASINSNPPVSSPTAASSIKEVSTVKWDASAGLVYKVVPGANLGVTSFEVLDSARTAYLSDASNEIIITNPVTGNIISRFTVSPAPRDFVYDKGNFYVLNESNVFVYDVSGKAIRTIPYPTSYVGVERLARYNNSTYLLLPSGYSVKIEANGSNVEPSDYKGWITQSGNYVGTKLSGNSYTVKVTTAEGKSYEKSFTTDKKVGGVYVVGSTATRVYIDVQTFVTESPISVERHIVSIELSDNGLGNIVTNVKVPDCYYVLSNKDFSVSATGTLLNMVTAPQGTFIFSMSETSPDKAINYPSSILAVKYHFNDHLVKIDTK